MSTSRHVKQLIKSTSGIVVLLVCPGRMSKPQVLTVEAQLFKRV